jgi:inositol oxygenase
MAPSAIFETPNVAEDFHNHRDGTALEATSDLVDDVNVLKAALKVRNGTATQEEQDIYQQSPKKTRHNSGNTKTPATE